MTMTFGTEYERWTLNFAWILRRESERSLAKSS